MCGAAVEPDAHDYIQQLFYGGALIVAVILPKILGPGRAANFKML